MKGIFKIAAALGVMGLPSGAMTEEFRYAYQADAQGLDPHSLNETFTLGFLGNVYEGLTAYDKDMQIVPALATGWTVTTPKTWSVKLRQGVTFHNGNTFDAEDVVFSWRRALSEGSDQKGRAGLIADIRVIAPDELEIVTDAPVPTLMRELAWLYIMDSDWAAANDAEEAVSVANANSANFANRNANGTGPFIVDQREAGVRTEFRANPDYWGEVEGNVTRAVFTPISQAPTRVAALLSGQIDLAYPVPVQDWTRLNSTDTVSVLSGAEARVIFLGMDQWRDALVNGSVTDANPLKDPRVRAAFAHAIDLEAIRTRIMRGASVPVGLMVAPQVEGFDKALGTPYPYDPEKSRALLAEAGYADGFKLQMDCPNDRYMNDEAICQAVVGMLAKVGVDVDLLAQTRSKFFGKILASGGYDTSFYLLGWTPGTMDSHNVLSQLMNCRGTDGSGSPFNIGNYCNPEVDALTQKIAAETDQATRRELIAQAFQIAKEEVGYLPLHLQPLSWGVAKQVTTTQRADDVLMLRAVTVQR